VTRSIHSGHQTASGWRRYGAGIGFRKFHPHPGQSLHIGSLEAGVQIAGLIVVALTGCGRVENMLTGVKSYAGFIERDVVLYSASGTPIKSWKTNNEIDYDGPVAKFVDKNGNTVRISGTFIIEGK
jgi:hypothetical protein